MRASEDRLRVAIALVVGGLIAALGVWAQNAALVGVNYDDGIYALLARALAQGEGYRLTHVPGGLPGVKYPPVYPFTLVPFWILSGSREAALLGMKVANGVYIGIAAGLFFLLLSRLRILPIWLAAAVSLVGFASGSMMLVTAGVLSEPLFLALLFAALWLADREVAPGGARRAVLIGVVVACVSLTRTIGVAAIVAVTVAVWVRQGRRRAGLTACAALLTLVPWLLFTLASQSSVPEVLVPPYGTYLQLYLTNLASSPWMAVEIFTANVGATLETLGAKLVPLTWIPGRSITAVIFIGLALLGSRATFRRAPATSLFPWIYLAVVWGWSFPPFRFVLTLFPLLLALAAASLMEFSRRAAARTSAAAPTRRATVGRTAVLAFGTIFLVALAYRESRTLTARVWDAAEYDKSQAAEELIAWTREVAAPDAVIAFEFDPLLALHTGRKTVPNRYEPIHPWYRTVDPPVEPVARLLLQAGVDYVAVRGNLPLAAQPIEALMARVPGSLHLQFVGPNGVMVFATDLSAIERSGLAGGGGRSGG